MSACIFLWLSLSQDLYQEWGADACLVRRSRLTSNEREVLRAQRLGVHSREAIEKGLGQAAAAAPLLDRVLRCKDAEAGRAGEGLGELWDVHLSSVVQQGIQALQNALT